MGRTVTDAIRQALEIPGVREQLEAFARRAVSARGVYEKEHWGQRGKRGLEPGTAADPTSEPLVVLGSLTEIGYLTTKGKDRQAVEYVHKFGPVLPRLCHAPSLKIGGLVIVGGSYTINERGIVG